jgi:polyisoprenoid-binding protein YceI
VARSERSQPYPRSRKLLLAALLGVAIIAVGVVVYLRYFYGDDAPPAFELSPAIFLLPVRRRGDQRSGDQTSGDESSGDQRSGRRQRRIPQVRVGRGMAISVVSAVAVAFATVSIGVSADAAPKAPKAKVGGTCTKSGAKSSLGATKLVCTKVGKKLAWAVAPTSGADPTTTRTAGGAGAGNASPTSVKPATDPAPASTSGIEGTWKTTTGSAAGYRVRELFVGGVAKVDAVGRTEAVTGSLVLARNGASLVAQSISVSVDTTKIESDETRRDNRMRTTGLETAKFPSATFVTTSPISLPENTEKGEAVKLTLPGKLTLHGVTRDVQFDSEGRLKDGTVEIVGRVNIKLPDFGIEPPEIADFVKADDDGTIEFKMFLKRA